MEEIGSLAAKPQGLVRIILVLSSILGAIGATPGLSFVYISVGEVVIIDLAMAGGALVAIALLISLMGDDSGNKIANIAFPIIYGIFCLIGLICLIIFFVNGDSIGYWSIGLYVLTVCLIICVILWIVDLILTLKG